MLLCTVTGCVGVTACVEAETFEPDLAEPVRMSSWMRLAYGISMRKEGLGSGSVHSHCLKITRDPRGEEKERSPLHICQPPMGHRR